MRTRTPTIYETIEVIDSLVDRTHLVRNTNLCAADPASAVVEEWVCFLKPEDSFESELVSHFPPFLPPKVHLVNQIYSASMPQMFYTPVLTSEQQKRRHDFLKRQNRRAVMARNSDVEIIASLFGEDLDRTFRSLSQGGAPLAPNPPDLPVPSKDQILDALFPSPELPDFVLEEPELVKEGDIIVTASLADLTPIPKHKGLTPFGVPSTYIQILFGIRAILLVLIDSSGVLCHTPEGDPDRDYIGSLPSTGAFSAIRKMSSWLITDFVPNCKYWKDYPLASCLGNPLPAVPETWSRHGYQPHESLFSGPLSSFWRRICHPLPDGPAATNLFRTAFSIAQSKKGFHPVPESFIQASYVKHAKALSKPTPVLDTPDLRSFLNSFFRHFRPKSLRSQLGKFEGSTSASNLSARAEGGAREDIRTLLGSLLDLPQDSFIRMVETNKGVVEERGLPPLSRTEWDSLLNLPVNHRYEELSENVLQKIPQEWRSKPFAKVRAITEPLKVRIITAMSALSSYISKVLQQALWDYLARFPCFRLITESFSPSAIDQLLSLHRKLFGLDSEWDFVSGDYAAATDNLNIQATKLVLEVVMGKLCEEDQILRQHFEEVLFEQVLIYPDNDPKPTLQTDGQLMGSVLSFPILCILNLYTYFKTLEPLVQGRLISGKLSYKCLPVLINGDDILFRANDLIYERWKFWNSKVGFQLSLGKNFTHPRFFTINSLPLEYNLGPRIMPPNFTFSDHPFKSWADIEDAPFGSFEHHFVDRPDDFRILGFPNIGLLIGLSKTASSTNKFLKVLPLNGWFEGAVMGAMYPEKMTNFFLKYHKHEIQKQTRFGTRTLNIYAHPYLGGLGFPIPPGVTPSYSEHQRALAAHLMSAAERLYYGPPSEHPLKTFTYLAPSNKPHSSLGNRPGRVHTRLIAPIGPLEQNEEPFVDRTQIFLTPLAMAYGDLEDSVLRPVCRLSNAELKALLKKANHQCMPLRPVSQMHLFPFRVAIFYPDDSAGTISPETVEPTTITTTTSLEPIPEIWELPQLPLNLLDSIRRNSVQDFKFRSTRDLLDLTDRKARHQRIRNSLSLRRQMNRNLGL
nr:MAG: hypothetical protein [Chemarfal virus 149]